MKINTEKCQKCHTCQICPGIEAEPDEFPRFNNLCSGCGEQGAACMQMCPFDAMEMSEMLRPGFLELLKPGGTILTAQTIVVPPSITAEQYPDVDQIKQVAEGYTLIELDVLAKAVEIGDASGRIANVVMMGALSKIAPFDGIPEALWLQALKDVTPVPMLWGANYQAFHAGIDML